MTKRSLWIACGVVLCGATLAGGIFLLNRFNVFAVIKNGGPLELTPRVAVLENKEPGAEEIVVFTIKNLAVKEISVVGAKTSCSCAVVENLPLKLQPNEVGAINVRVKLPTSRASYDQSILFMISASNKLKFAQARVVATIRRPLLELSENEEGVVADAKIGDASQEVGQ